MNLLLDTHALYWFLRGDRRLSTKALRAIENPRNSVLVSAVSGYELALKELRGKFPYGTTAEVMRQARREGMAERAVELQHAMAAGELPGPHFDPWDRLLMAQSRLDDLVVVTSDGVFENYGVRVLW